MSNTVNLLNGLEHLYPDNNTISQMKRTLNKFPECESALVDAYSLGQLKSKEWLVENLPDNLGTVFICAGWYGTLANMMFEHARHKFDKIRSFDIDETCAPIADTINRPWVIDGWQFKASTANINNLDYPTEYITFRSDGTSQNLVDMPNTIINTSCEHIKDFNLWYEKIPVGTTVVLQTNNYFDLLEHINCCIDLDDFSRTTPMQSVYYQGELNLSKYTRFMRIGIK